MTAVTAIQDVQISISRDLSTVTFGGATIDVSADGKTVTAYTNEVVETRPISAGAAIAKGTPFSVSEDFNAVVLNGVSIERAPDGHLIIAARSVVITKPSSSKDSRIKMIDGRIKTIEIGDRMDDGTIFAGISPDTSEPMYTTPADAPLTYRFNQAKQYAANLESFGHNDWRVPTENELSVLFENRVAIGGFNETGSYPAGWYCSSAAYDVLNAWGRRFSDKVDDSSVRCVWC